MPLGKYGHIVITKELIDYYIDNFNELEVIKMPEMNLDPNVKSVGLSEFIGAQFSLVERYIWDVEVASSNPAAPTIGEAEHR